MPRRITKAVFPIAGLGTRFLPATKSIPKEIMTLVDRPLIQYAIDEARAAGITEYIFVTSRGKSALEDYFDDAPELELAVREKGRSELLQELNRTTMKSGTIAYVRQHKPLGLGHAVWCARQLISPNEMFAVILPDDVIAAEVPCLQQMIEAHEETGGCMVATMEVSPEVTSTYGVLDVDAGTGPVVAVRGLIEKPDPGTAPSNLAVIGRYILSPEVLIDLARNERSADVEIHLTDAIANEVDSGRKVYGYRFDGQRFDCGSKAGFLQATVAFGLAHDELGHEFAEYLVKLRIKNGPLMAQ